MCIVALALAAHPRWQLVLAGNRDELHARPAAPLARWDAPAGLIAGRDLQSGGTWLGVSDAGRMVVVTNRRGFGTPAPGRPSRGLLAADLLAGADPQAAPLADYNPFSLFVADGVRARFVSNRPEPVVSALASGVYGLSNGALDEPWPKTLQLKSRLLDWMVGGAEDPRDLFAALRIDTLPAFGVAAAAPSDAPLEAPQSPIFIRDAVYGTRCSTVVAIDMAGGGIIVERRFAADGAPAGETAIEFRWPT